MNKKLIECLINVADSLDQKGLVKEANIIDTIIQQARKRIVSDIKIEENQGILKSFLNWVSNEVDNLKILFLNNTISEILSKGITLDEPLRLFLDLNDYDVP